MAWSKYEPTPNPRPRVAVKLIRSEDVLVGDNAPIFGLLSEQFPDEHITNCIDARVVSHYHTSQADPEDPTKTLHTIVDVLECPHCKFECNMLLTTQQMPD